MPAMRDLTAAWVGADDAARTLGITRATLYAYVSRGLIRSEPGAAGRPGRNAG
mgnify:CR=1 FL=1